jgi:CHAT domain-containing protein
LPATRLFPPALVERVLPAAVTERWQDGQRLLVSPHERLRSLPLHAVPSGQGGRLIDRWPVQYIPTLALLPLGNPAVRPEAVLLVGCEQDGFGGKRLKEVPDEIRALQQVWSNQRPGRVTASLLRPDGSPSQAGLQVEKWQAFEFVHIACHGTFPEERPLDAALRLGKEAVRASEFFTVRLPASLVSLSACALGRQTQRHAEGALAGQEWVGLYLPLFYAGTQALLVSLWDADSGVAALFMKTLHTLLSEGMSAPEAYQKACHSVIRKPAPYWANWYLVGFPDSTSSERKE